MGCSPGGMLRWLSFSMCDKDDMPCIRFSEWLAMLWESVVFRLLQIGIIWEIYKQLVSLTVLHIGNYDVWLPTLAVLIKFVYGIGWVMELENDFLLISSGNP